MCAKHYDDVHWELINEQGKFTFSLHRAFSLVGEMDTYEHILERPTYLFFMELLFHGLIIPNFFVVFTFLKLL